MKRVLIIEAQMKQYRKPFYERLHDLLREDGVELRVAYSDPSEAEKGKRDNCELPDTYGVKVKGYWFANGRLLFQPVMREIREADLVVIDLANKFVLNHFLLLLSRIRLKQVAFWGLGENKQQDRSEFSEWYKKRTLNWVSWWFAYTEGTAGFLEEQGVPGSKITVVHNAVDTQEITAAVRNLDAQDRAALCERLGIPKGARVGIFCGMLDRVKSIPFLIESSRVIKNRVPDFHLIIVGGGPEKDDLERKAKECAWIHMVGPRFGKEKAEFMAISQAFLLPGRVGLAVLDAFAGGLPLLTTELPIHGPEFEYLEENVNGLVTANDPTAYAEKVAALFNNTDSLARLQAGARASAEKYSIESMVAKFREGIQSCLGLTEPRVTVLDRDEGKREAKPGISDNGSGFTMTTSWDDGHPLDLRIAELLSKYELQGTFYVPLENTRPTLSSRQILELSSAFEIGAHTVHHLVLTTLPESHALSEITESKSRLQEITGKPCAAFCFPSGRYAEAHLDMVSNAGYSAVRTVELLSLDRPRAHNGVVIIPTTAQAYPHSSGTYLRNAARRLRYAAFRNFLQSGPGNDWSSSAISLLKFARATGGVFHLWGHSWEIEEYEQWEALERVFAAMAEASKSAACLTNSELCRNGR